MKIEVLMSCMHQKDIVIVSRSNLQNIPTVVINQCDVSQQTISKPSDLLTWIDTPTRGLSVSRNLALQHTMADICVIADDDEVFNNHILQTISNAYTQFPQADIIIFSHPIHDNNKLGSKPRKLSKYDLLKVSSRQITFRKKSIYPNITFDINLGAGTNNGGGEENKFLLDSYKAKLQIYFVPHKIASHYKQVSTWFFGYDANYFYNRGKSTRYIFGFWFACLYGVYFLLAKYSVYKGTIPLWTAAKNLFYGISRNELKIYD